MSNNVLLIDIGSTNIKWALSRANDQIVFRYNKPFPHPLVDDGTRYEVAIEDVVSSVMDIINDNMMHANALMLSVQMHAYVLRAKDGRLLSNLITWRDHRAADYVEKLTLTPEYGVRVKANLPRLALMKLKDQDPSVFNQIGYFYTLGSYLAYLLTGVNMTHISDAAASGYYHLETLKNDPVPFMMPTASKQITIVGKYRQMDVYTPIGDHQASLAAIEDYADSYILNLGTAGQMCAIGDEFAHGAFETRPFFDNKHLFAFTGVPGGHYLKNATDAQIDAAVSQYKNAIKALPSRHRLLILGGPTKYQPNKIATIVAAIGLETTILENADALEGLNKLWRNIHMSSLKTGIMLSELYSPNLPILLKKSGYDFFIIDCEHGAFDYFMINPMITIARLVGIKVLIRLPDNQRRDIIRLLDAGVDGFILPNTNCINDIAMVIEHAKYPPVGKRGVSTMRAHTFYDPKELKPYVESANHRVEIYAEIETRKGVDNAEAILALDGVTGAIIGPNDLSMDYGVIGSPINDYVMDAIKKVGAIATALKKVTGIITGEEILINHSKKCGFDLYCLGSELSLLKKAGSNLVSTFKKGV